MTKFLNITKTGEIKAPVSIDSPVVKINGDSVAELLNSKEDSIESKGTAFNKDFGTNSGTVAEGNHNHQFVGDNILTSQSIAPGVAAQAPVYYSQQEEMWKRYTSMISAIPGIYIGDGKIALDGAIIELQHHSSDILYIDHNGYIRASLFNDDFPVKKTIGYRVGSNHFKVEFSEYKGKLSTFCEKIYARDAEVYDFFGWSTAIDGNVAIVSAYGEDTKGSYGGAAYIFRYNGSSWVQDGGPLHASDGEAGDNFGNSVAISGDVAIVGAYSKDTEVKDGGAAYIFRYNGSSWVQEAKLQANDPKAYNCFGTRVAISGNVAFIGISSSLGGVYVFRHNGSSWEQEGDPLHASDGYNDFFGSSIALSEDIAVIGARWGDNGETNTGVAYILQYNGSSWIQEAKLQASDAQNNDNFGGSVAISENVAIVGALGEDTGGSKAGAAYIFRNNGSSWTQEAKLQAADKQADDWFGQSVAISGNMAIVGAFGEDTSGNNAGAVYIFRYNGSSWIQETKLQACDVSAGDNFGHSVAFSNEIAIVGAHYKHNLGTAYIFDMKRF